MRILGLEIHRSRQWPGVQPCPATQRIHTERGNAFKATTAALLAHTGKSLPAVEKMIEVSK